MTTAQSLIDEVTIDILADKDWDDERWEELKVDIEEEDEKNATN